jgi:hypothetical protein
MYVSRKGIHNSKKKILFQKKYQQFYKVNKKKRERGVRAGVEKLN